MPKTSEIADLGSSFTAKLEKHIGTLADAHLSAVFAKFNVRAPAAERFPCPRMRSTLSGSIHTASERSSCSATQTARV